MFNHLYLQGKCTYVTFIHHVFSCLKKVYVFQFYTSLWAVYLGNFPIGTYISQNSGYSLANLQATIEISISAPSVNQIYF